MGHGRRIEDRVRELCALLSIASDDERVEVLIQLQRVTHEHTRRLANKNAAAVLTWPKVAVERRKKRVKIELIVS